MCNKLTFELTYSSEHRNYDDVYRNENHISSAIDDIHYLRHLCFFSLPCYTQPCLINHNLYYLHFSFSFTSYTGLFLFIFLILSYVFYFANKKRKSEEESKQFIGSALRFMNVSFLVMTRDDCHDYTLLANHELVLI